MQRCVAMDWEKTEHDYVLCDSPESVKLYRLEGLLLAVEVWLCEAHRKYFEGAPPGWRLVTVTEIKTA